jgi:hypothetical protein
MSRSVVLFAALLILGRCTRQEATARLRGDLQSEDLEIIRIGLRRTRQVEVALFMDGNLTLVHWSK